MSLSIKVFRPQMLRKNSKYARLCVQRLAKNAFHDQKVLKERKVTLIPGDGAGPDLVASVKLVFKALGVPVKWDLQELTDMNDEYEIAPIDHVVKSIEETKVALMGVIRSPMNVTKHDEKSANLKLRSQLDLFANVVRCRSIDGIPTRHRNVDFVVVREQTEGEYSCLEHETVPGVIEMLKVITREKSERIAKFAFDYALKANRKKITCIHKANIQKVGDGLFLESCTEISKLYPRIQFESMIVDNACMQLVSNPCQFDVLVLPNLYGGIINNIAAGLVGGAGVVPGRSIGRDYAVFSLGTRHTYGQKAGENVANPTAMLLSSCNLLDHIHMRHYATAIRQSIFQTIGEGKYITMDIGGSASMSTFTKAVIDRAEKNLC